MSDEESPKRKIQRSFIIITVLFFIILAGFGWVISDIRELSEDTKAIVEQNTALVEQNAELVEQSEALIAENQKRIDDIQQSRLETCNEIFTGIFRVFRPFFPDEPLTAEQRKNLATFTRTIRQLNQDCIKNVREGGG